MQNGRILLLSSSRFLVVPKASVACISELYLLLLFNRVVQEGEGNDKACDIYVNTTE